MNEDFGVRRPGAHDAGLRPQAAYERRFRGQRTDADAIAVPMGARNPLFDNNFDTSDSASPLGSPVFGGLRRFGPVPEPSDDGPGQGDADNPDRQNSQDTHDSQDSQGSSGKHGGNHGPAEAGGHAPGVSHGRWYQRLAHRLSRRQWLLAASTIVLLAAGGTAYALTRPEKIPKSAPAVAHAKPKPPVPPPSPTSPLTGLPVSADDAKHIVTGVMIENSLDARPQSGLQQAGVVYEAIAEAGITRFLALFQEAKPANIGPIRSARPYYVDFARSYDAPLAHVGGSPDALAKIKSEGDKDLDQFFNGGSYHRISSRIAPHNVYTSMDKLNQLEQSKGWTSSNFTGFARKKDAPSKSPDATKINMSISSPSYSTHYDYDAASNSYKRSMAGTPHIDADTKQQISPKVVIAIVTDYGLMADGYHSAYRTTGSGQGFVFQDGTATPITWTRPDAASQYQFADSGGHPVKLNAGQTWISLLGAASDVSYAP